MSLEKGFHGGSGFGMLTYHGESLSPQQLFCRGSAVTGRDLPQDLQRPIRCTASQVGGRKGQQYARIAWSQRVQCLKQHDSLIRLSVMQKAIGQDVQDR